MGWPSCVRNSSQFHFNKSLVTCFRTFCPSFKIHFSDRHKHGSGKSKCGSRRQKECNPVISASLDNDEWEVFLTFLFGFTSVQNSYFMVANNRALLLNCYLWLTEVLLPYSLVHAMVNDQVTSKVSLKSGNLALSFFAPKAYLYLISS